MQSDARSPRWTLRALRWSYCVFIAAASLIAAESAVHAHGEGSHGGGSHGARMILALAVTEAIAALALAIERVELVACAVLLLVYTVAAVVSALPADWVAVLRFIFYAVTATYIVLASRTNKRSP